MDAEVAVVRTRPDRVLDDYRRVMHLARYQTHLPRDDDILVKLNLSWTRYFPAASSAPWQLEGVVRTLLEDGYAHGRIHPVENKTVVTDPMKGAKENGWAAVLNGYDLDFTPLPSVEWVRYPFKSRFLKIDQIFPEGIEIPKMFVGKRVLHLPTLKTHGHSVTTGAIKNAFGGLLKEVRHYCHKYIHEVLVDLMLMQREIHPGAFAVMDGTVCGDGAGPRTMIPRVGNVLLAGADSVAVDALAAQMMGFRPLEIPYIRICHEMGLGVGDPARIRVVGDDISQVNFQFTTKRSIVIWGDQMIRRGFLRPFERVLLRSPLMVWAPVASTLYHDYLWYPIVGRARVRAFAKTEWGRLLASYLDRQTPRPGVSK